MSGNILKALETFELDQHHEKIYADPNELIGAGFPAFFLLPLLRVFESGGGNQYFRNGKFVDEMIGISHLSLIYAVANHLEIPSDTGSRLTGRGFAMRANIDAIRKVLDEHATNSTSEKPSPNEFAVVIFLKKEEQFENAKAELLSIVKGRTYKLLDQDDSIAFVFAHVSQSQAEALCLELAHFPKKYGSIVMLQNPLS